MLSHAMRSILLDYNLTYMYMYYYFKPNQFLNMAQTCATYNMFFKNRNKKSYVNNGEA